MGEVFISYRREDVELAADRLFEDLSREFGKSQIFFDHESLRAGSNFVDQIQKAIGSCSAVVVLIGRDWLAALNERSSGVDYMLQEITTALGTSVPTIPVLIDGATMPEERDLPHKLRPFALCHALEISTNRWDHDVGVLIAQLRELRGGRWKGKVQNASAVGGAAAGVVASNAALGTLGAAGLSASLPVVVGTMAVVFPVGAAVGGYFAYKGVKRLLNSL